MVLLLIFTISSTNLFAKSFSFATESQFNPYSERYLKDLDLQELQIRNDAIEKKESRNSQGNLSIAFGIMTLLITTQIKNTETTYENDIARIEQDYRPLKNLLYLSGAVSVFAGAFLKSDQAKRSSEKTFEMHMKNKYHHTNPFTLQIGLNEVSIAYVF